MGRAADFHVRAVRFVNPGQRIVVVPAAAPAPAAMMLLWLRLRPRMRLF